MFRLAKLYWNLLIIGCITLWGCQDRPSTEPLHHFLLEQQVSMIINIKDYQTFKSTITNSHLKTFIINNRYDFISQFRPLNISFDEVYIAISQKKGNNKYDSTLVTRYNPSQFTDSLNLFQLKIRSATNTRIVESSYGTTKLYGARIKGVFITSTSIDIVKAIIRKDKSKVADPILEKLYLNADSNSTTTLFINNKIENPLFDAIYTQQPLSRKDADWMMFDSQISKNKITFSGISKSKVSTSRLQKIFSGILPAENNILSIAPEDTKEMVSYSFKDAYGLLKNLSNGATIDSLQALPLRDIDEIGLLYGKQLNVLTLHSTYIKNSQKVFHCPDEGKIYSFKSPKVISLLSPLVYGYKPKYICSLGDFIILGINRKSLSKVISYYRNNFTYRRSLIYKQISDDILNASNVLKIKRKVDNQINNFYILQGINNDSYMYLSGVVRRTKISSKTKKRVVKILKMSLDTDIDIPPQFIYNHRTKGKDIIVQDSNHNLYLMDYKGKIFWKRTLDEQLISPIRQVDLYRNNRYQMALVSPHHFSILDRDNHIVKPFNFRFEKAITKPLVVFDYEQNKDYRFVITLGNDLQMYDRKGKKVNGFKYKISSTILNSPKHFRIIKKDYIGVMTVTGKLHLLNRKGKIRLGIPQRFDLSGNELYFYKNAFTTTDTLGRLIRISPKTKVHYRKNAALTRNHQIDATSKTLAIVVGNQLTIERKTITLEAGRYTAPKIFYLQDIIYIAVTNLDTKRTYLYYSDASLVPGFPVYGSSIADIADADGDGMLEMIVQTADDAITLYKIKPAL